MVAAVPVTVAFAAGPGTLVVGAAALSTVTLVVGAAVLSTVTLVAGDVVTLPASSVARAVSECAPFVDVVVFHVAAKGAVVSVATTVLSTRNSSLSTRRSSDAAAAKLRAL